MEECLVLSVLPKWNEGQKLQQQISNEGKRDQSGTRCLAFVTSFHIDHSLKSRYYFFYTGNNWGYWEAKHSSTIV